MEAARHARRLAAIAGVMVAVTACLWVATEVRKDERAEKQCRALQQVIVALDRTLEHVAQTLARGEVPGFGRTDAADMRARKVRPPDC